MRKKELQKINFDTTRPLNLEYERAVFITPDAEYPMKDILLGTTLPHPEYHINRGATQKYYILEYVIEGRGKILFDGVWYNLSAGDTYVIDKNTVRNYYSDPASPLRKTWVSFESDYIDSMFIHYGIKPGIYRADTKEHFDKILATAAESISVKDKVFGIASAVHEIILAVAKTNSFGTDSFTEIKNDILKILYEKGSLEEVASRFFMSKSNLIRLFKKHTGVTPYRFLLDEKIKLAKVFLKSTDMSIRAIAEELHFTDEHYFSYMFKERVGISPLKYRNGENN